jgi:hypothetical protein
MKLALKEFPILLAGSALLATVVVIYLVNKSEKAK